MYFNTDTFGDESWALFGGSMTQYGEYVWTIIAQDSKADNNSQIPDEWVLPKYAHVKKNTLQNCLPSDCTLEKLLKWPFAYNGECVMQHINEKHTVDIMMS